jgi:hypothetical protein
LTHDSSGKDETEVFTIPESFILAIGLPIHAGLNVRAHKFFVRSIAIFSTGYRITIGYDDGTDTPPLVAAAVVSRSSHVEYTTYVLSGLGDFIDTKGLICIGSLTDIENEPVGEYFFDITGSRLEPDAIIPTINYVSGMVFINGSQRSSRFTGDIELVAGSNIRFTITDGNTQHPRIRIDASDGAGLTDSCECDETVGPPIRTINGIAPTLDGNFTLLGSECVEISSLASGLKFVDTCSKPCCDCPELTALVQEQQFFGNEARTTQGFVNRLASAVDNMSNVILGSTLSDDSCLTCTTE